jgi:2-methylcitrate dehydratase PrpD
MTKAEVLSYLGTKINYEESPADLLDRAKYLILDYLGLAARGSRFESSEPILNFVCKLGGQGKGTVVGIRDVRPMPQ